MAKAHGLSPPDHRETGCEGTQEGMLSSTGKARVGRDVFDTPNGSEKPQKRLACPCMTTAASRHGSDSGQRQSLYCQGLDISSSQTPPYSTMQNFV